MKSDIIKQWEFHRGLALDILKSLTDEQLELTVGKHMGTLGEQFRHMARVQIQYTEAIKNKKISKTERKIEPTISKSQKKLLGLWEEVEKDMVDTIQNLSVEEVENINIDWKYWGTDSMKLSEHLQALSDHENLHNGQIIAYLKTHAIPFPKSWESWGL